MLGINRPQSPSVMHLGGRLRERVSALGPGAMPVFMTDFGNPSIGRKTSSELANVGHAFAPVHSTAADTVVANVVRKTFNATIDKTVCTTFGTTVDTTLASVEGLSCWFAAGLTVDWFNAESRSWVNDMAYDCATRTPPWSASLCALSFTIHRAIGLSDIYSILDALKSVVAHACSSNVRCGDVYAMTTAVGVDGKTARVSLSNLAVSQAYSSVSTSGKANGDSESLRSTVPEDFSISHPRAENTACVNAVESACELNLESDAMSSEASALVVGVATVGSTATIKADKAVRATARAKVDSFAQEMSDMNTVQCALLQVFGQDGTDDQQSTVGSALHSVRIEGFDEVDQSDVATACVAAVHMSPSMTLSKPPASTCNQANAELVARAGASLAARDRITDHRMVFEKTLPTVRDQVRQPSEVIAQRQIRVSAQLTTFHNALVKTVRSAMTPTDTTTMSRTVHPALRQIACTG